MTTTQKKFWDDSYLTQLETRVARVDGPWVRLAETVFYALSGGQESDAGCIADQPVLEARKQGLEIDYRLHSDHGLQVGAPVQVTVEWPRRYRLMRLHFAAELLLELVYRQCPGIEKIGAHISAEKARIDFLWPQSLSPLYDSLLAQAHGLIEQDGEIRTGYSDEAAQRRYWELDGFARVACGGTHVRRTGEVGRLRLKRKNIGRGKERIEVYLIDPDEGLA